MIPVSELFTSGSRTEDGVEVELMNRGDAERNSINPATSTEVRLFEECSLGYNMLIRAKVRLSSPLERSGHTLGQTYGLRDFH